MNRVLLILTILFTINAHAQINLSSQLINADTKAPIEFASVLLLDVFEGTITDENGLFRIEVDTQTQQLLFQSIGFESDTFSVADVLNDSILSLKPADYLIGEIVVFPKSAFDLVRKAVAKIPENYDAATIAQNIFYRQEIIANDEILSLEEANFDALIKFKNKSTNLITIKKARAIIDLDTLKSLGKMVAKQLEGLDTTDMRENASQVFALNFFLSDKVEESSKNLFTKKGYQFYKYNFNGLVKKDNTYAYHVTFDQLDDIKKSLFKGHFYIDTSSLAFMDVQIYLSPKGIVYQKVIPKALIAVAKLFGYTVYFRSFNYNVHYKNIDNKWVMDKADSKLALKVSKRNGITFDGHMKMTFEVNKFYLKEGFYNKKSKYDKLASNPKDFYNTNFWENYHYLPLSSKTKELIDKVD